MKKLILSFTFILFGAISIIAQDGTLGNNVHSEGNGSSNAACNSSFPNADKTTAVSICDANEINVSVLGLSGAVPNEASLLNSAFSESHAAWYKFSTASNGSIQFHITPLGTNDDIDFILYKKNSKGIWEAVRAAVSGPIIKEDAFETCSGQYKTGMINGELDAFELDGCTKSNVESVKNAYVSPYGAQAQEDFLLLINNFMSCKGFRLAWVGNVPFAPCAVISKMISDKSTQILSGDLFPNPTNNTEINLWVQINTENKEEQNLDFVIFDVAGKAIKKGKKSVQDKDLLTFDISELSQGAYQLYMYYDKEKIVKKFIVH
jgi:hypothetical protein